MKGQRILLKMRGVPKFHIQLIQENLVFPVELVRAVLAMRESLIFPAPRKTRSRLRPGGGHILTGHCPPSGNAAAAARTVVQNVPIWHKTTRAPGNVESLAFPLFPKSSNLGVASP